MTAPSKPSPRQVWWRAAQTVALVAFAFSLNGWKYDSCNKQTTIANPLNGRTATRLHVDVQPPEMRPLVRRLTVEVNSAASTSDWRQVGAVTGLSGNPTSLDVDPANNPQYRIQAYDACNQLLGQTVMATGVNTSLEKDRWIGPDELNATLALSAPAVPCSPSPSPSSSVSPSPSPAASLSPAPSAGPTPTPAGTPTPYSGGGGGGSYNPPPSASVTVNLNGQIQRGSYASSEARLSASPSPSESPSVSPTPSAWLSASP